MKQASRQGEGGGKDRGVIGLGERSPQPPEPLWSVYRYVCKQLLKMKGDESLLDHPIWEASRNTKRLKVLAGQHSNHHKSSCFTLLELINKLMGLFDTSPRKVKTLDIADYGK